MYYRQPRYYREFQCKGGKCFDCCCGWSIAWTNNEVEKVKNAPSISPDLKELVENSFVRTRQNENEYVVKFDEQKSCPFLTEDRLCRIQKELGAEYLSSTCMVYPRNGVIVGNVAQRFCHSSCREITTEFLNDEKSMELVNIPIRSGSKIALQRRVTNALIEKRPELKYYNNVFEFYYELISDRKISVETALILGALASQRLNEIVNHKDYDRMPEALKAFRKQFHNDEQLRTIENIKPNYYLKFGFLSEIIEKVVKEGTATALLHDETGALNIDLYNKGEEGLHEALKGREYFLRNIALDLLFELDVMFNYEDKTLFENYSLLATVYGLQKLNLIAACSTETDITIHNHGQEFVCRGDDKLIGPTAIISRICHHRGMGKKIIALLNNNGFTSPAYLALLIK